MLSNPTAIQTSVQTPVPVYYLPDWKMRRERLLALRAARRISPAEYAVLEVLNDLTSKQTGIVFMTRARIAEATGLTERAIMQILQRMRAAQYLVVVEAAGSHRAARYRLTLHGGENAVLPKSPRSENRVLPKRAGRENAVLPIYRKILDRTVLGDQTATPRGQMSGPENTKPHRAPALLEWWDDCDLKHKGSCTTEADHRRAVSRDALYRPGALECRD